MVGTCYNSSGVHVQVVEQVLQLVVVDQLGDRCSFGVPQPMPHSRLVDDLVNLASSVRWAPRPVHHHLPTSRQREQPQCRSQAQRWRLETVRGQQNGPLSSRSRGVVEILGQLIGYSVSRTSASDFTQKRPTGLLDNVKPAVLDVSCTH